MIIVVSSDESLCHMRWSLPCLDCVAAASLSDVRVRSGARRWCGSSTTSTARTSSTATSSRRTSCSTVPTPGNFYVNLPPLFLGHFSPIFPRFFPIFSPFSPSCPQDSGNRHQDPEKRSETVEKRRVQDPKLTLMLRGAGTCGGRRGAWARRA